MILFTKIAKILATAAAALNYYVAEKPCAEMLFLKQDFQITTGA